MSGELPEKGSLNDVFGIHKTDEWQEAMIDKAQKEFIEHSEPVSQGISFLMSMCGLPPIPGTLVPDSLVNRIAAEVSRHFFILGMLRGVVLAEEKDWANHWEELMSKQES